MSRPLWLSDIAEYFEAAAPSYAQAMTPAFGPLAERLVRVAAIQQGERALDVGTGSGLVARAAGRFTKSVISLDLARAMLERARQNGISQLIEGDFHLLPFAAGSFDLVLASFTLNSGDPQSALCEIGRVLVQEGRFVFQEWDAADPLSELVSDTFAAYTVDEPPHDLATLRAKLETPLPWDTLETVEDLLDVLDETGFEKIELARLSPAIRMHGVRQFLRYKLAWPIRQAELAAMSQEVRTLCMHDLQENLELHTDARGYLVWQPNIVRVVARRPFSTE